MRDIWDIRSREKAEEKQFTDKLRQYDEALEVIKRSSALRSAAGFTDFVKSIENLRDSAQRRLVSEDGYTDAGLREARGRVRALNDILSLLVGTNAGDLLAARRQALQNDFDDVLKRRPKPHKEPS